MPSGYNRGHEVSFSPRDARVMVAEPLEPMVFEGSPRACVGRRETFSAAHQLCDPELSAEENHALYGQCVDLHGHNYTLEVMVSGDINVHGYVCDLRALKQVIHDRIIQHVDHRDLNHAVPWLVGLMPTTEVLAQAFWRRLVDHIPEGRLELVRVYETKKNFAECRR